MRAQIQLIQSGGGSDLTPQPKLANFHPNMDFFRSKSLKIEFPATFVFMAMSKKSLFGPLLSDPKTYLMLILALYRVT